MIFNGDLCTMSLPNTFSLQLHAPFSPQADAQHLVRPTAALAKTAVSSSLLHRCMGHRSIQALGIASSSNMWEDTTLNPDNDAFFGVVKSPSHERQIVEKPIYPPTMIYNLDHA